MQGQIIMGDLRKNLLDTPDQSNPFNVNFVNCTDEETQKQFEIHSGPKWQAGFDTQDVFDCFLQDSSIDWKNTIYLSPDAPEPLLDFCISPPDYSKFGTSFILGGLIDRTVVKGATLTKW